MLQDVESNKIACIVVNDLSRLGRELISTGYYIESYFPAKKIRFVSINDRFDTANETTNRKEIGGCCMHIPFVNALNEQVSNDIQRKVSTALDTKAQHGLFIGPRAPYGYQKAEYDSTHIVPDPEAAAIVKRIFEMAAAGTALTAMVRALNEQHIPTPIQYARQKGLEGNYDDGNGSWNSRSVKYILTNRTYTGMLVQGKEKRAVESTHTPLVDAATFEAIQKSFQEKAFHLTPTTQQPDNLLKGKVFCRCCGGKMQRKRGTNHADWHFYTCITKNRLGADKCTGMYIREEDVFSAIYHQLKLQVHDSPNSVFCMQKELNRLHVELEQHKGFQAEVEHYPMMNYEQYRLGEIDRETYNIRQQKIRNLVNDRKHLEEQIEQCSRKYQKAILLQKASYKEAPLSDVIDQMDRIVVDAGRKVSVQWKSE